eukprot:752280_1
MEEITEFAVHFTGGRLIPSQQKKPQDDESTILANGEERTDVDGHGHDQRFAGIQNSLLNRRVAQLLTDPKSQFGLPDMCKLCKVSYYGSVGKATHEATVAHILNSTEKRNQVDSSTSKSSSDPIRERSRSEKRSSPFPERYVPRKQSIGQSCSPTSDKSRSPERKGSRTSVSKERSQDSDDEEKGVCSRMYQDGYCESGKKCGFSHDLVSIPEHERAGSKNEQGICVRFYEKGRCKFEDECKFSHDVDKIGHIFKSKFPCFDFASAAGCKFGDICRFSHEPSLDDVNGFRDGPAKSRRCKFFDEGFCRDGEKCSFAHDRRKCRSPPRRRSTKGERSPPRRLKGRDRSPRRDKFSEVCRDFLHFSCFRGDECRYTHDAQMQDGPHVDSPPRRQPRVPRSPSPRYVSKRRRVSPPRRTRRGLSLRERSPRRQRSPDRSRKRSPAKRDRSTDRRRSIGDKKAVAEFGRCDICSVNYQTKDVRDKHRASRRHMNTIRKLRDRKPDRKRKDTSEISSVPNSPSSFRSSSQESIVSMIRSLQTTGNQQAPPNTSMPGTESCTLLNAIRLKRDGEMAELNAVSREVELLNDQLRLTERDFEDESLSRYKHICSTWESKYIASKDLLMISQRNISKLNENLVGKVRECELITRQTRELNSQLEVLRTLVPSDSNGNSEVSDPTGNSNDFSVDRILAERKNPQTGNSEFLVRFVSPDGRCEEDWASELIDCDDLLADFRRQTNMRR